MMAVRLNDDKELVKAIREGLKRTGDRKSVGRERVCIQV